MNDYTRIKAAIICRPCNGDGRVAKDLDELDRTGSTSGVTCGVCDGSGLSFALNYSLQGDEFCIWTNMADIPEDAADV